MTVPAMIAFVARMIPVGVVIMKGAALHVPSLQRFRAKWIPVRVRKTRQNKSWNPALMPSKPVVLATAAKHSHHGDIL
ncbi:hypothetical protein V4R08_08800 [Nitrobacter sp. NHB1]|uniref:hypothetical protein n=1 Tax=Nitrobacter sp. NHB1 TaxID=3119830 RepID=UPI003000EE58